MCCCFFVFFFFFRHPSTLNQATSFAEEFVTFNVQCLDVLGEETVDDVPVEREVGEFDDQRSDLAETVESLIKIERQVFAFFREDWVCGQKFSPV